MIGGLKLLQMTLVCILLFSEMKKHDDKNLESYIWPTYNKILLTDER